MSSPIATPGATAAAAASTPLPPSSASNAASSASAAAAPAAPRSFLERVISPAGAQSTRMFRLMNPELFVERTKKVSPAAWLVTGMVGFVVVTIGYTQWEYTHTTKRIEDEAAARKVAAREARKQIIRQQLDSQEAAANKQKWT